MTKMIKMSLIAAVAVTGMTSTVCAQPLEDAIKGVDVSGQLRYRYDDKKVENGATTQTNEYSMKVDTKSKINDVVTANVQIQALGVSDISSSDAHATSDTTGDRDVTLSVTKANFAANLGFATVVAGKQSIPSPFVDGNAATDDVTRGTGAVALIPAGPVTLAAGHFMNLQVEGTTVNSGASIDAAAILGSVANVNFDAWYVKVNGVGAGDTTFATDVTGKSLGLATTVAGVALDARTSTVERVASDSKLTKLVASTKVGPVSVVAGYAVTPAGNVNSTIDTDNDAKSGFRLWQASIENLADTKAYLVGAGMDVMPNVNIDVKYVNAEVGSSTTVTEALYGATYKMSKNFGVHARYSVMTKTNTADSNKGRLELKYTF